jgi:hypothetical protein
VPAHSDIINNVRFVTGQRSFRKDMGSIVLSNYYPETSEGRAEWWENLLDCGEPLLSELGMDRDRIAAIMADAAWGVYTYGTLTSTAERYFADVVAYANAVASGVHAEEGVASSPPPKPPEIPAPPAAEIGHDFERRRLDWVQEVKELPEYTREIGVELGIEPVSAAFNGGSYRADLHDVLCSGPKTITGKFRKAHGQIDGIVLRGRHRGSASWTELGRFKATPFSAYIPVAGPEPEDWEFQARALKRDIEVGIVSPIVEAAVKG